MTMIIQLLRIRRRGLTFEKIYPRILFGNSPGIAAGSFLLLLFGHGGHYHAQNIFCLHNSHI